MPAHFDLTGSHVSWWALGYPFSALHFLIGRSAGLGTFQRFSFDSGMMYMTGLIRLPIHIVTVGPVSV